jgi:TonB family protein
MNLQGGIEENEFHPVLNSCANAPKNGFDRHFRQHSRRNGYRKSMCAMGVCSKWLPPLARFGPLLSYRYMRQGAMLYADSDWDTGGPAGRFYFCTAIMPNFGRNIIMAETCENCRRVIAVNETPCLWQGAVVCAQCRARLEAGAVVLPGKPLMARLTEIYRQHPVVMAIATGAAAAVALLLVAILAAWMSWASGQTSREIKAGIQGVKKAVAVVLPVPSGSIHGRVWWRTSAGVMHLGRDKNVWLIRRTVPRAAVLAILNQPKLHAALVALIARIPVLEAAYLKAARASAAYDKAYRAYDRAQAAYYTAMDEYERHRDKVHRAYRKAAGAAYHRACEECSAVAGRMSQPMGSPESSEEETEGYIFDVYQQAQAAYHKALEKRLLLAGHLPPRIGTFSAIKTIETTYRLCGGSIGNVSGSDAVKAMVLKAMAAKTKADFKGHYHFTDIPAGRYFFIIPASTSFGLSGVLDYRHPVTVAGGENIRADINEGHAVGYSTLENSSASAIHASATARIAVEHSTLENPPRDVAGVINLPTVAANSRGPLPNSRGLQPHAAGGGAVQLFKPRTQNGLGSATGSGPGRGAGVGGGGSIVTPPPNPIMPRKYQSAWPAHLVSPKFQLTIRRNGTVANVKVLISSGHTSIDRAIIKALLQARFLPNIVGGKPVQSKFVIRYQLTS